MEAGFMSAGALMAHSVSGSQDPAKQSSAAFVSLTVSQILHTLSASADHKPLGVDTWPRNKKIYGAMGLAGGTIALGVVSPWFRRLLGTTSMTQKEWVSALLNGLWPLAASEVSKLILEQRKLHT